MKDSVVNFLLLFTRVDLCFHLLGQVITSQYVCVWNSSWSVQFNLYFNLLEFYL